MKRHVWMGAAAGFGAAVTISGCNERKAEEAPPTVASQPAVPDAPAKRYDALPRLAFNQMAVRRDEPLYWSNDADNDGAVDPDELRTLRFYPAATAWVESGRFSPRFDEVYGKLVEEHGLAAYDGSDVEKARRQLVRDDLDQGAPTLVYHDLRALAPAEKTMVGHILEAAKHIDRLYAKQLGIASLAERVPRDDLASQSLFRRNWGPECRGPATEANPQCSAIPGAPSPRVDVYPADLQANDQFCKTLEAAPNARDLLTPFTVVRAVTAEGAGGAATTDTSAGNVPEGGATPGEGAVAATTRTRRAEPAPANPASSYAAVPYHEAYREEMGAIATSLRAAASAITDASEAPFKAYLTAAAQAFTDNQWEPADEAWAAMNARNSKWYLRVGPDEVYWDPCSRKAGFHLTFARINRGSLEWQDKLTPLQQEMEGAVAKLIGPRYRARSVSFHLPDFIDIVVNAGDDRDAFGATVGQSLPNWGPVANEGRGRTVAMSNLYTDPDSRRMRRDQASSLLDVATSEAYSAEPATDLLSTILHEATHNLGPAHEYRYRGKTDDEAFGGGMASMLEELKSQSGALYFVDLLRQRGILDEAAAKRAYVDSVVWAFGHISRGMYTPDGQRKAYSQLAAIQLGFLIDEGVVTWDAARPAANGRDRGAFAIDFARFPAAAEKLMRTVATIKATNDRAGAEALAAKYVDGQIVPMATITERVLRFPKASFVYALDM